MATIYTNGTIESASAKRGEEARQIAGAMAKYYDAADKPFLWMHTADIIRRGWNAESTRILNEFKQLVDLDDSDGIRLIGRLALFLNHAHSGKWCAQIVHTEGADFPTYAYRGEIYFASGAVVEALGCDWSSFCADVNAKTGIRFPLRKDMKFHRISSFEQFAGLDAAHTRGTCHVTKTEIDCGWRAYTAIIDALD